MPSLTQLEYIIAVQKFKHFGRAAQECHVSQPSLSAQIHKAEQELDTIIFDRSKKPILTTEKGEQIIEQAKLILKEHKKLLSLSSSKNELKGDFHLGIIPTLSASLIPLFVESFSKKYPLINLKISEYKTEDIISKLYDDELDGGLLVTPLNDNKIIEHKLFYEPFYAFVASSHEYFERKYLRDSELDENTIWLLNEGHCFRDQVIKICSVNNDHRVLNNVSFESGSLETLINLIRKGRGYTLLPYLTTQSLSKQEILKNLKPFKKPVPTREVSLVHSRSVLKEGTISILIQEIINSIPVEIKSIKKSSIEIIDL